MSSGEIPWRGPGEGRPSLPLPPGAMPLWRDGGLRKRWRYVGFYGETLMLLRGARRGRADGAVLLGALGPRARPRARPHLAASWQPRGRPRRLAPGDRRTRPPRRPAPRRNRLPDRIDLPERRRRRLGLDPQAGRRADTRASPRDPGPARGPGSRALASTTRIGRLPGPPHELALVGRGRARPSTAVPSPGTWSRASTTRPKQRARHLDRRRPPGARPGPFDGLDAFRFPKAPASTSGGAPSAPATTTSSSSAPPTATASAPSAAPSTGSRWTRRAASWSPTPPLVRAPRTAGYQVSTAGGARPGARPRPPAASLRQGPRLRRIDHLVDLEGLRDVDRLAFSSAAAAAPAPAPRARPRPQRPAPCEAQPHRAFEAHRPELAVGQATVAAARRGRRRHRLRAQSVAPAQHHADQRHPQPRAGHISREAWRTKPVASASGPTM